MKTIKNTKTEIKEYITAFEANDGTKFYVSNDNPDIAREECKKYEASAKGVITERVQKFKIADTTEGDLTDYGSEEYRVEIFKPSTEEELNVLMMYLDIKAPSASKGLTDNAKELRNAVLKVGNEIIVWWNYKEDWYSVDTLETWTTRLKQNYIDAKDKYKEKS